MARFTWFPGSWENPLDDAAVVWLKTRDAAPGLVRPQEVRRVWQNRPSFCEQRGRLAGKMTQRSI